MEYSEDIKKEIIQYLDLEYGESSKLHTADLVYLGVKDNIQYWEYPSNSESWVKVEPFEESHLISITTAKPNFE